MSKYLQTRGWGKECVNLDVILHRSDQMGKDGSGRGGEGKEGKGWMG